MTQWNVGRRFCHSLCNLVWRWAHICWMYIYFTGGSEQSEDKCSTATTINLHSGQNSRIHSRHSQGLRVVCVYAHKCCVYASQSMLPPHGECPQAYLSRSALFLIDLSWLMALLFSIEILAWCARISLLSLSIKSTQTGVRGVSV